VLPLNTEIIHCRSLGSVDTISFLGLYRGFFEDFMESSPLLNLMP
jgi:hypothetical protein